MNIKYKTSQLGKIPPQKLTWITIYKKLYRKFIHPYSKNETKTYYSILSNVTL